MKIISVAVLGAGAVGSYVIWGLADREDIKLGVIAEGERKERLSRQGCAINGKVYHPEVWTPEEAENVDFLIVSLKYGALPGALESIRKIVGKDTSVMSLMNGVDSEEIIFGEYEAPYESERVKAVKELFAGTGIHYRSTEYAIEEVWCKFRLNVCNNLPQAILGAGVGCYRDSEHMKAIQNGLKKELEAIAEAKGIDISKADRMSGRGSAVPPKARYSTLQDLDAGRHTEIDMFSGALMRMGKELGIPTPYNEYTYHMIKALEEKNDGRFAYTGEEEPTWSK